MPSKLYGAPAAGRLVVFIGDPAGDCADRPRRPGPGRAPRGDAGAGRTDPGVARHDPARLARMGAAARRAYDASTREASLDAWTRCLRAAARPAEALPQAAAE